MQYKIRKLGSVPHSSSYDMHFIAWQQETMS